MSDIKKWKTPAASNVGSGFTPPDGFPEGMLRSDLNDSMREVQASIRRTWDDPDWKDPVDGFTVVQGADTTKVKIQSTDAMEYFKVNQKVRVRTPDAANYAYAFVASVAMVGSDTEVTLEDFDTTGTPTPSGSVHASCNGIDIYFLGGGDTNNHGIGRSAFEPGESLGFEVPATEDVAGINAAIVAASSNGKTVLLPKATIALTDAISIPAASDDLRIVGMGVGQTILKRNNALDTKDVITVEDDAVNITIENIQIDGNCTNNTTAGHGINFGDNVQNVRLRDLLVVNCWSNAINFGGTDTGGGEAYSDIWIESTKIDRCGNTGIFINDPNGANARVYISDVSIARFGDTGNALTSGSGACGIDIDGPAKMSGITIDATSTTPHASFAGSCILFREAETGGTPGGGSKAQLSDFRITGDFPGVIGLKIRGADNQISNGYINLTGTGTVKPISVEGLGAVAEAAFNTILSGIHVADGTWSEVLGNTDRTLIDGCRFSAASTRALLIGGLNARVQNCVFDGAGGTIADGIVAQAGSTGVSISNCEFDTLTGDAITIAGDGARIGGNSFSEITGDAITIASDGARIGGNSFSGITGAGVDFISGGTNGRVYGNRFDDVTLQHVVDGATGNVVTETNSPKMLHLGAFWVWTSDGGYQSGTLIDAHSWPGDTFFSIAHPQRELGSSAEHRVTLTVDVNGIGGSTDGKLRLYVGTSGDTSDEVVCTSDEFSITDTTVTHVIVMTYTPSAPIGLTTKLTGVARHTGAFNFTVHSYVVSGATRTQDAE